MKLINRNTKAQHCTRFIFGARLPAVIELGRPFGHSELIVYEGVGLLANYVRVLALEIDASRSSPKPNLVARLDEFENTWVPISRATLTRHYPELAEAFFEGFQQAEGKATAVGLIILVTRLQAMKAGEAPFGEDGPPARELLAKRGLTDEVEAEAQALIDEFGSAAPDTQPKRVNPELEKAEKELWDWYLEWSAILRVAVKKKSLLRAMGFGTGRRSSDSHELEGKGTAPALPAAETSQAEGVEVEPARLLAAPSNDEEVAAE